MNALLLAGPGLIWGASFLFIAEGLGSVGPFGVTFLRILVGFAALSLVPAVRTPIPRSTWLPVAGLSFVWMAFPLTMFPLAEQHVSSALTGMLNGANPVFTAIVASVLARRAPSRAIIVGLATGVAGAVLMALPTLGAGRSSFTGIALIVAALVSYGFALNIARPLQLQFGALPVIWRALALAVIATAPLGLRDVAKAHWTLGPALSLLALGALGTGAAYVMLATAAGRVGAIRASATTFLIPPVALVLGVLIRHESVAFISIVGGAVCLAGAWIMYRAQLEQAQPGTD